MQNRIKISVDGKSFTLVGEESEEHMRQVAEYIDGKMREVRQKAVAVTLDASLAYILTSINVADDYLKEKNKVAELENEVMELTARLQEKEKEGLEQEEIVQEDTIQEEVEQEDAKVVQDREKTEPADGEFTHLHPMAMKGAEHKPPVRLNNKKKKRKR